VNKLLRPFARLLVRALFPGIANSLEAEGQFDLRDRPSGAGGLDLSRHIDVEDNASDTTLVCFAGMAVLYAAMPKFEFRKTLAETGGSYNYVWVRDIYRSSYDLAPDGSPDGLAFYTRIIDDALATLGSKRNIAIGASGGGAAAFAFSGVLPIHQVIAFNPAFPLDAYGSRKNICAVLFDIRKLLRKPNDYIEVVFVTLSARYLVKRNQRIVGAKNMTNPLECYLRKQPPARATIFYSTACRPDTQQIEQFNDIPSVSVKPIESARHNCMGELKLRGELASLIHDEFRALKAEPNTAQ
jgi:hypothetical protein